MSRRGGWLVERRAGTASVLHESWPPDDLATRRVLCRCEVTGPALVLGSAQRDDDADVAAAAGAGVAVVRRSSGGGAVLVSPGAQLWLDVWVPRGDTLWQEDVVRAAWWLGGVWAGALRRLGAPELHVHRGRAVKSAWSERVCFAGVGPGEVTLDGRKVVGMSQRRTRAGVRMSTMALLRWEPAPLLALLALEDEQRADAVAEVEAAAIGLERVIVQPEEPTVLLDAVATAVLARLP